MKNQLQINMELFFHISLDFRFQAFGEKGWNSTVAFFLCTVYARKSYIIFNYLNKYIYTYSDSGIAPKVRVYM
jgi:hypothetical protein